MAPLSKELQAYRKSLTLKPTAFPCPDCKESVLPSKFERHCSQRHRVKSRTTCVWCREVTWRIGSKQKHAAHLMACFQKAVEGVHATGEMEEETFPFFDLPDLVQWMVLREYVSIRDKTLVLRTLPGFDRLLNDDSFWFKSSLAISHFMRTVEPGWYTEKTADSWISPDRPQLYCGLFKNKLNLSYSAEGGFLTILYYDFFAECVDTKHVSIVESKRPVACVLANLRSYLEKCFYQKEDSIAFYAWNPPHVGEFVLDDHLNRVYWYEYRKPLHLYKTLYRTPHRIPRVRFFPQEGIRNHFGLHVEADGSITAARAIQRDCKRDESRTADRYARCTESVETGKITLTLEGEDVSIRSEYNGKGYDYWAENALGWPRADITVARKRKAGSRTMQDKRRCLN